MTEDIKERKTFYYDDYPCRAGGVLPYVKALLPDNSEQTYFLFIVKYLNIEAFGGKTDIDDNNIRDTAYREAMEESNDVLYTCFDKTDLKDVQYFPKSKYLLYCIQIKDIIDPEKFGDREIHDNIKRKVIWLTYDQVLNDYNVQKIDKTILISKMKSIISPKENSSYKKLMAFDDKSCCSLLLPELFKGIDIQIAQHILRTDLDVSVRFDDLLQPTLMCVTYKSSINIWTNKDIPYKIRFLAENRGTIYTVTSDYLVACFPFEKFWNYNHPESRRDKLIWDDKLEITEKLDGFIYKIFYYGKWHVSTNSEVDASTVTLRNSKLNARDAFDQAAKNSNFNFEKLNQQHTYIFEVVHPEAKLLVQYDTPRLYHLGTRDMKSLKEINEEIAVPKPKRLHFKSEEELLIYINKLNFWEGEGVVVCDKAGYYNNISYWRIKYKSNSYMDAHTLLEATPKTQNYIEKVYLVKKWLDNSESNIKYTPELITKFDKIAEIINEKIKVIIEQHDELDKKEKRYYFQKMPTDKFLRKILTPFFGIENLTTDMVKHQLRVKIRNNYMFEDEIYKWI